MGKRFIRCERISKKMRETIDEYKKTMLVNDTFINEFDKEDHKEHTYVVYTNAITVKRNKEVLELEEDKLYEDLGNMNTVQRLTNNEQLNHDPDNQFDVLDTFYIFDKTKYTPRDMDKDLCQFFNEFNIDYIYNEEPPSNPKLKVKGFW